MDPSGTFLQYDAKAIGSGSEGAQQSLQEVYHKVSCAVSSCGLSACKKGKGLTLDSAP